MDVEERFQLLCAQGFHEEACVLARDYIACDEKKQDLDTAYRMRILLGETLLSLSVDSCDVNAYVEAIHLLMQAYNERGNEDLYHFLYTISCAPNEELMRTTYASNRSAFSSIEHFPPLSDYEQLPIRFFRLTDDYSVIFDKDQKRFLLNVEESSLQILYRDLVLNDALHENIALCEERLSRADQDSKIQELGRQLMEAVHNSNFCAEMGACAETYKRICPYGEMYEVFRAEEALAHGDAEAAIRYGEAAYEKRKMSRVVYDLLYRIYKQSGQMDRALLFMILPQGNAHISFTNDPEEMAKWLRAIKIATTGAQFAPFITDTRQTDHGMKSVLCIDLCEELPRFSESMPRYRTGIYNPYGQMYIKSKVIELMNTATEQDNLLIFNDFVFDVVKAEEASEFRAAPVASAPVLIPIAAKQSHQMIRFRTAALDRTRMFSKGELNFYRVEEAVAFQSATPFIVGEPIILQHRPQCRKLVLSILADGLSWKGIDREAPTLVPNILKFFSKGIIFDHHFSTAEYTYPALATIETGLYQHKTQIAKPGIPLALDPSYVTISEQMKNLGYYCTNIQGDGEGIYNGVTRGYDRLIVNHWMLRATDGVERTIRHLETFDECDNFLFMHFADTHPYNADVSTPAYASTHLPLSDVLQNQDRSASVFLKPNPLSKYVNHSEIAAVDRQLGYLFDYLTSHYDDDEYIVMLYSDHGTSVHARSPYLLSEEQTGAALMARGAGVPALGRVDELTSSVDIYKILGKLADYPIDAAHLDGNLPEAFGGQRREYTVSNSIYPGQTYKICVRTEHYAFHLETAEFTREDGTISLDRYTYHIHERSESYREVFSDALARYFMDIVWKYTESFRR